MSYHYFFAIKLPSETKKFLQDWIEARRHLFPFKRWVHPEDYHITLAFLGSAENKKLQLAQENVKMILNNEKSFSLTLHQLGTFGASKQPRIFWADVIPSDSLTQIQKKVYNQCMSAQIELDKKPFRPHITLARKWGSESPFNPNNLLKITEDKNLLHTFIVEEVVLYETHLDQIPKYHEYEAYLLK